MSRQTETGNASGAAAASPRRAVPDMLPDTPDSDEVIYDGPPMTAWTAAYLWAGLLTALHTHPPADQAAGIADPGDSPARTFLARAISIAARNVGLTGADGAIAGPGALSRLSLPRVSLHHLDPVVALIQFIQADLGHQPTPGEPGHQAFLEVYDTIRAGGVTAADVLHDPQLGDDLDQRADQLTREVNTAAIAIAHAIPIAVPDTIEPMPSDVAFGALGGYFNNLLAGVALPDYDTEFRTLLAHELGWPHGNPPASLLADPGPWYRVGFTPATEKSRAWCRWLLQRGWAVEHTPGHLDDTGVWLALPAPYARDLWGVNQQHFPSRGSSLGAWRDFPGAEGDRPTNNFLQEHYGEGNQTH